MRVRAYDNQVNSRIRLYNNLQNQNKWINKSSCSCKTNNNTNGLLEDILSGGEAKTLTTVGIAIEPQSILMLTAAIIGAGLIIKNLKIK